MEKTTHLLAMLLINTAISLRSEYYFHYLEQKKIDLTSFWKSNYEYQAYKDGEPIDNNNNFVIYEDSVELHANKFDKDVERIEYVNTRLFQAKITLKSVDTISKITFEFFERNGLTVSSHIDAINLEYTNTRCFQMYKLSNAVIFVCDINFDNVKKYRELVDKYGYLYCELGWPCQIYKLSFGAFTYLKHAFQIGYDGIIDALVKAKLLIAGQNKFLLIYKTDFEDISSAIEVTFNPKEMLVQVNANMGRILLRMLVQSIEYVTDDLLIVGVNHAMYIVTRSDFMEYSLNTQLKTNFIKIDGKYLSYYYNEIRRQLTVFSLSDTIILKDVYDIKERGILLRASYSINSTFLRQKVYTVFQSGYFMVIFSKNARSGNSLFICLQYIVDEEFPKTKQRCDYRGNVLVPFDIRSYDKAVSISSNLSGTKIRMVFEKYFVNFNFQYPIYHFILNTNETGNIKISYFLADEKKGDVEINIIDKNLLHWVSNDMEHPREGNRIVAEDNSMSLDFVNGNFLNLEAQPNIEYYRVQKILRLNHKYKHMVGSQIIFDDFTHTFVLQYYCDKYNNLVRFNSKGEFLEEYKEPYYYTYQYVGLLFENEHLYYRNGRFYVKSFASLEFSKRSVYIFKRTCRTSAIMPHSFNAKILICENDSELHFYLWKEEERFFRELGHAWSLLEYELPIPTRLVTFHEKELCFGLVIEDYSVTIVSISLKKDGNLVPRVLSSQTFRELVIKENAQLCTTLINIVSTVFLPDRLIINLTCGNDVAILFVMKLGEGVQLSYLYHLDNRQLIGPYRVKIMDYLGHTTSSRSIIYYRGGLVYLVEFNGLQYLMFVNPYRDYLNCMPYLIRFEEPMKAVKLFSYTNFMENPRFIYFALSEDNTAVLKMMKIYKAPLLLALNESDKDFAREGFSIPSYHGCCSVAVPPIAFKNNATREINIDNVHLNKLLELKKDRFPGYLRLDLSYVYGNAYSYALTSEFVIETVGSQVQLLPMHLLERYPLNLPIDLKDFELHVSDSEVLIFNKNLAISIDPTLRTTVYSLLMNEMNLPYSTLSLLYANAHEEVFGYSSSTNTITKLVWNLNYIVIADYEQRSLASGYTSSKPVVLKNYFASRPQIEIIGDFAIFKLHNSLSIQPLGALKKNLKCAEPVNYGTSVYHLYQLSSGELLFAQLNVKAAFWYTTAISYKKRIIVSFYAVLADCLNLLLSFPINIGGVMLDDSIISVTTFIEGFEMKILLLGSKELHYMVSLNIKDALGAIRRQLHNYRKNKLGIKEIEAQVEPLIDLVLNVAKEAEVVQSEVFIYQDYLFIYQRGGRGFARFSAYNLGNRRPKFTIRDRIDEVKNLALYNYNGTYYSLSGDDHPVLLNVKKIEMAKKHKAFGRFRFLLVDNDNRPYELFIASGPALYIRSSNVLSDRLRLIYKNDQASATQTFYLDKEITAKGTLESVGQFLWLLSCTFAFILVFLIINRYK